MVVLKFAATAFPLRIMSNQMDFKRSTVRRRRLLRRTGVICPYQIQCNNLHNRPINLSLFATRNSLKSSIAIVKVCYPLPGGLSGGRPQLTAALLRYQNSNPSTPVSLSFPSRSRTFICTPTAFNFTFTRVTFGNRRRQRRVIYKMSKVTVPFCP